MPASEPNTPSTAPIPLRPFGRTGQPVTIFGLGGEGVLRTHGREAEAVAVIQRALQQGVNYFETAPAYASSMDYYGLAFGACRPLQNACLLQIRRGCGCTEILFDAAVKGATGKDADIIIPVAITWRLMTICRRGPDRTYWQAGP